LDKIYIFLSGHARQNNGDAGIGICFHTDVKNAPFFEEAEHIGIETQNSAVYRALLRALNKSRDWHFSQVEVYTDNRLVVSQLAENMSARAVNIIPLYDEVKSISREFNYCQINYVQNKDNQRSRELARYAALASPDMVTAQALQFEVQPGITGLIMAFTPKLMIVQFKYKKGSIIGEHHHLHEQASYLLKGTLKYRVANKDIILIRGAALVVSSNSVHQVEALEDSTEIVTYAPMRADLLKIS
jgi:quercetin dioxygenase-like cupin family protein